MNNKKCQLVKNNILEAIVFVIKIPIQIKKYKNLFNKNNCNLSAGIILSIVIIWKRNKDTLIKCFSPNKIIK